MTRKLLLTIAFAMLGVAVAAASVNAQGGLLGSGQGGVSINLPDGLKLSDLTLADCPLIKDQQIRLELGCPKEDGESGGTGGGGSGSGDGSGGSTPPPGGDQGPGAPGDDDDDRPDKGDGDKGSVGPGGKGGRGSGSKQGRSRDNGKESRKPKRNRKAKNDGKQPTRTPDGRPTRANPSLTIAEVGAAPIGVPNFLIDQFAIPPFLLQLYQACGTQYGIPWQVLASINRIETNFGQNLNVSSAGAVGWMQFMPASWRAYGVDANGDGRKDPYNPYDAICAAANYLDAHGWEDDPRGAIFAYNHADWYVDEVLLYARQYGKLPDDLIGSITGLTEGARFPVAATSRYADDISERRAARRVETRRGAGNVADVISSSPTRRGINIFTRRGAPVVAVNDGVITKIGKSKRLGRHIILRDTYGNRFIYARLGEIADVYPVPKRNRLRPGDFRLVRPTSDREPQRAATDNGERSVEQAVRKNGDGPVNTEDMRERLYAHPERPRNAGRADLTGQLDTLFADRFPGYESFKAYFSGILRFDRQTMRMEELEEGSKVIAGTVLGRVDKVDEELAPNLHFAIRPAGRGAPRIDPKPILDGWKLLEATAIYRAAGKNPFTGSATSSQVLLMSKPQLIRRVLADPRLEIYACGRDDIRAGQINRRILAALAYLSERGFRMTITSLRCGRSSIYTSSGGVSHHVSGNAVDIARINGLPVLGNQGAGSVTEALVRDTMRLQGAMAPNQIISLHDFGANTFAMGDHADHVHIGYSPLPGEVDGPAGVRGGKDDFRAVLKPGQWERLVERLAGIDNPSVRTSPSRYALPARKGKRGKNDGPRRASTAHVGE